MQQGTPRLFAPLDAVIILAMLAGAAFFLPAFTAARPGTVAVYRDDRIIAEYPLDQSRTFIVKGEIGPLTVEIDSGAVHILRSTCRHQVCVNAPPIRRSTSQIICAPNHIILEVRAGEQHDAPDAVTK